jgi:uncharacterized membrane protein YkoI
MQNKLTLSLILGLLLFGAGGISCACYGNEDNNATSLSLKQLPSEIRTSIEKYAKGATVEEIELEIIDGSPVYEVSVHRGDVEFELTLDSQGKIIDLEFDDEDGDEDEGDDEDDEDEDFDTRSMKDAPAAARRSLQKLAGSAKIIEFDKEHEAGVLLYEAAWRVKRQVHEAKVTAAGDIVETEQTISLQEAPKAVQKLAKRMSRQGVKVKVVRKEIVLYEFEMKVNGREREQLVTPLGQPVKPSGDYGSR